MRLIIAGGRDFKNYELLKDKVKFYTSNNEDITIISGTANGADRLGERYANENEIDLEYYPANWNEFGKSAGYIRNKEMAKTATHLIAFWDGKSKGTKHMINLAKEYNLDYRIVRYE